jgi:hypothetical protein
MAKTFPSAEDMKALGEKCTKLKEFKANVLRTTRFGGVEWKREESGWKGGIVRTGAAAA